MELAVDAGDTDVVAMNLTIAALEQWVKAMNPPDDEDEDEEDDEDDEEDEEDDGVSDERD